MTDGDLEPNLVTVKSVDHSSKTLGLMKVSCTPTMCGFPKKIRRIFLARNISEHFQTERKKFDCQAERRILQLSNSLA